MKKKKMFHALDCLIIAGLCTGVLLDTFVISRSYAAVTDSRTKNTAETETLTETADKDQTETVITDTSYQDENISIQISEYEWNDTVIHVADVQISSPEYLYSALAGNTYGRNVTDETSDIADTANAILAVNGDYYGARNEGYVLRNGTLYRETSSSSSQEDLVINADGSFTIITEGETDADTLYASGAQQVYSFGPALIINGETAVGLDEEVGKAMASNPRTAICEIEPLHYLFVVSDGRTDESEGLSLYELARFLEQFDVKTAYNLDGGGSSTMVFNGEVINNPTTSGRSVKERKVSDAVCIGL